MERLVNLCGPAFLRILSMEKMKWTAADMPEQGGKTVIVTGANSGLGYETTKALAMKGAEVVMACRSLRKAEEAAAWIREEVAGANIHVMSLDLASLASVKAFAESFLARFSRLDILINNAGLMALPLCRTEDGFEMQLGTNHFGHFALTMHLLPAILASKNSRVVQVTSEAHQFGAMDFNDLNWEKSYSKWRAYGRSKLANLMFALELDRRFKEAGSESISLAAHPGYANTNLFGRVGKDGHTVIERLFMGMGGKSIAQTAEMGALPQLYAATSPLAKGGKLYGPDGWLHLGGYPAEEKIGRKFADPQVARTLWEHSERLTGTSFKLPSKRIS